jgi:hypothetical protein
MFSPDASVLAKKLTKKAYAVRLTQAMDEVSVCRLQCHAGAFGDLR